MNEDVSNDPRYTDQYESQNKEKKNKSKLQSFAEFQGKRLLRKLALKLARQAVMALARTPIGLIVGLVILAIIVLLFIFFGKFRDSPTVPQEEVPVIANPGGEPSVPGLTLSKTGDTQINFGENITYSISVSYSESTGGVSADKIVIVDKLPTNTQFVSATGMYVQSGNTIEWPLIAGTSSYSFTLIVKPTIDNVEISNTVYGRSLAPSSKIIDGGAENLNAIFEDSARVSNVPVALLKAIAKKESGVLGYLAEDVNQFNTLNWWAGLTDNAPLLKDNHPLVKKGYAYNTCQYVSCFAGADVRGAMQFELQTWNGFKPRLSFTDGHDPDRRYVRDIIYAAGLFLRDKIDTYDLRFNFTANLASLSENQVKALARSYCAGNPDASTNEEACGYGTYEGLVWSYYLEYNN